MVERVDELPGFGAGAVGFTAGAVIFAAGLLLALVLLPSRHAIQDRADA